MRLQEIKKIRIVIASLLKPVDDTRMFEKLGQTLEEDAYVHIIGYPSKVTFHSTKITIHSLLPFNRLSWGRMIAPWKIFRKVLEIKPDVFIITTHELLLVGVVSKIFLSCRLIYDIQENYFRNILYTDAFPRITRPFISTYVRIIEWLTSPFVNHFLLAERGYEKELSFPGNRRTIIENKTKKEKVIANKKNDGQINLLFTGTLAETTGVFTAIELAQKLHAVNQSIRLTIIGFCSQQNTLEKIKNTIRDKNFIKLIGGNLLIPHAEIIKEIQSSNFGIIAYAENQSIINSIPTKLYEYLGNQLPILMVNHKPWLDLANPYQAAMAFSLTDFNAEEVLDKMKNQSFYTSIPKDVFWENEVEKLKNVVHDVLA